MQRCAFISSSRVKTTKLVAEKGTETEHGVSAVNNGVRHRHARAEHRLLHFKEKHKLSDVEKSHQVPSPKDPFEVANLSVFCVYPKVC